MGNVLWLVLFVLAEILSGEGWRESDWFLNWARIIFRAEKKRSVKCKSVILEDIWPKFPHFHNPASLGEEGSSNNNTSWHTLFSTTLPWQVTCDSLFEEIVSTQIRPTNISYYGLQGFSLKNNLNHGVKSLVPLGKKRVGPNPIRVQQPRN